MSITIQDAVDHLYEIAVARGKAQSTKRPCVLADYCVQELAARGMRGAEAEQTIQGGGREKNWDVAWRYDGKFRLAISLKSMLQNLAGTVPNRVDDLMGEVANAQLHSPEIVIGYIILVDVAQDRPSRKHGTTWAGLLRDRLRRLSGREPPNWTVGTVESHVLGEVDFSTSARLLTDPSAFATFFDALSRQVRFRNPNALPPE